MDVERNIIKLGEASKGVILPPDLLKWLELDIGDTITLRDEKGNKGKYCSFWKNNNDKD